MLSKRHKYCRLQISYSPLQYCWLDYKYIVKLQSKLNSPVQVGPGVDFVFPLSQEQEQEQEQEHPHQNLPDQSVLQTWNMEHSLSL